jgi:hypothetical protein
VDAITDFRIDIPETSIEDPHERLRLTRWPAASPEPSCLRGRTGL